MREAKEHLKEGQLVAFEPSIKDLENFPYVTCGYVQNNTFTLYEKVDLESFPSWNDFHGARIRVKRGEMGIILNRLGEPHACSLFVIDRPDIDLGVYTILMRGHRVQAFGVDLLPAPGPEIILKK